MGMTISGFIALFGVSALAGFAATFVGRRPSAPADPTKTAYYRVCAGETFTYWFELKNAGAASWTDVNDTSAGAWGKAVRLQTSDGKPDVLAGNNAGQRQGEREHRRRPRADGPLTKAGISGTAPAQPASQDVVVARRRGSRDVRGPGMYLTYDIVACPSDAGVVVKEGGAPKSDGGVTTPGADGGDIPPAGEVGCSMSHGTPARGSSAGILLLGFLLLLRVRRA